MALNESDENMVEIQVVAMNEADENIVEIQMEECENIVESNEDTESGHTDSNFHWNPDSISILLHYRLTNNHLWLNPNAIKHDLWEGVSQEMLKFTYKVSGHECDMKYRNLLKTYKSNKDKIDRGKLDATHWPYYDIFESHLSNEYSEMDPQSVLQNVVQGSKYCTDMLNKQQKNDQQQPRIRKRVSAYQWVKASTHLMLKLRFEKEEDFSNPLKRKVFIWKEIAKLMRQHGYDVPGHACDAKYRNLLATYRKVKEKLKEKGSTFVRWEYFDIMDSHLGHIIDTPTRFFSRKFDESGEDNEIEDLIEEEKRSSLRKRFLKRTPRLSISNYLQLKLRADEKQRQDYLALEEKKLRLEDKRLELEQKKIDVLKALVIAVKQIKPGANVTL